jgi:hypothetical protein
MQYFHGTKESMQQGLRAIALLWNFHPYTHKVQRLEPYSKSPFEDLVKIIGQTRSYEGVTLFLNQE